jgi:hypothetical protein
MGDPCSTPEKIKNAWSILVKVRKHLEDPGVDRGNNIELKDRL